MKWLMAVGALLATSAQAHVVMAPAEATAGGYYAGEFRIGHGCDDAATTSVRIEIPQGVLVARPRPKPGWTIEIERMPLPTPVVSEGKELRERVSAITWLGLLPADQFDTFGVMFKVPEGHQGSLYLPVRQTCGDKVVEWREIPAEGQSWGALKRPAPVIALAPATGRHSH